MGLESPYGRQTFGSSKKQHLYFRPGLPVTCVWDSLRWVCVCMCVGVCFFLGVWNSVQTVQTCLVCCISGVVECQHNVMEVLPKTPGHLHQNDSGKNRPNTYAPTIKVMYCRLNEPQTIILTVTLGRNALKILMVLYQRFFAVLWVLTGEP